MEQKDPSIAAIGQISPISAYPHRPIGRRITSLTTHTPPAVLLLLVHEVDSIRRPYMQYAAMAGQTRPDTSLDLGFWMRHSISPILAFLRAAGAYSAADQGEHIRILCDHILPNIGPRPTASHPIKSSLTNSGSPIEISLNLRSGKPSVRYCAEILGSAWPDDADIYAVETVQKCLTSLCAELGLSRRWSDELLEAFIPTAEEAKRSQENVQQWMTSLLPPGLETKPVSRLPFAAFALDLDGPRARPKLFLLEGVVSPSIDMLSIDLVKEEDLHGARVKMYLHTTTNSFNTVRQCLTLGGRRQDETTIKGLETLRTIWHLMIQEKDEVADDYEKPVNDAAQQAMKLFLSLEITPGRDLPEVKLYVPVFTYMKSDAETVENFEIMLEKCNQEWASSGKYRDMFETAFGDLNRKREAPIHSYASFYYNESGVYQTLYFCLPRELDVDGENMVERQPDC
ncbi:aromatic prenyl transferase [Metarhizium acridum CQMa 102]|uniref:Aromatic prenyl transferase n=1 Tax=Metarhizium acridum (strain CQMa 102) TaxID=655827 RepID=E9E879_METAQ|nr:aromatic prenyl transferase [Metarhizium acridum CQMa 102]EFY87829.1 aromatic prenyl transferase [Metarhizium acridum CQMa 102]